MSRSSGLVGVGLLFSAVFQDGWLERHGIPGPEALFSDACFIHIHLASGTPDVSWSVSESEYYEQTDANLDVEF